VGTDTMGVGLRERHSSLGVSCGLGRPNQTSGARNSEWHTNSPFWRRAPARGRTTFEIPGSTGERPPLSSLLDRKRRTVTAQKNLQPRGPWHFPLWRVRIRTFGSSCV